MSRVKQMSKCDYARKQRTCVNFMHSTSIFSFLPAPNSLRAKKLSECILEVVDGVMLVWVSNPGP